VGWLIGGEGIGGNILSGVLHAPVDMGVRESAIEIEGLAVRGLIPLRISTLCVEMSAESYRAPHFSRLVTGLVSGSS
jgi:hypothetical protein